MPPYQSGQIPRVQNPSQSGQVPPVAQPYQSGQIPPVTRPYQSGQIPTVQAPQQGYSAQPAAQLPVMPVEQATESHAPARRNAGGNGLLRVGIIAAIAAALLLVITLVLVIFKPFGLFEEKLEVDRPSTAIVEDAFNKENIPSPDMSSFAYVNDDDLKLVEVSNYKAGEVQYGKSNGSPEAHCEASAEAEYENDSVSVRQSLTMRMDYDKQTSEWKPGSIHGGTVSATPEGPADIDSITENFLNILKTYDSKIADMYVGAEVTSTSSLTKKGGTASFTATKTEGDSTRTCNANADVTWSDTNGWNVEITSVTGDIDMPEEAPAAPEEPEQAKTPEAVTPPSNSEGSEGDADDGATMILGPCNTGDLVEVAGTIHFDNSGAILLKLDARYRVVLDGRTYVVDYFEIGVGTGGYRNGQREVIIGEISYRGAIQQAPLFINVNY